MLAYSELSAAARDLVKMKLTEDDLRWLAANGYEPAVHEVQTRDRHRALAEGAVEVTQKMRRYDMLGIDYDVIMAAGTGYAIGIMPRRTRALGERR